MERNLIRELAAGTGSGFRTRGSAQTCRRSLEETGTRSPPGRCRPSHHRSPASLGFRRSSSRSHRGRARRPSCQRMLEFHVRRGRVERRQREPRRGEQEGNVMNSPLPQKKKKKKVRWNLLQVRFFIRRESSRWPESSGD